MPQAKGAIRTGAEASRRLARSHYENFSVGSRLLPRSIRLDLFNIYAFCRLADDLVDEPVEGFSSFETLDLWDEMIEQAASGKPVARGSFDRRPHLSNELRHYALFAALGDTIRRRNLPTTPFHDLLQAFRQDLTVNRYRTWDDLLDYCRLSANPVGRLVLAVCGQDDPNYFAYSDKICTGLQLANHWQDVFEDYGRGRIYIPLEIFEKFSLPETIIPDRIPTKDFRRMIQHLTDRAEELFQDGKPLVNLVGKPLSPQLYLYWGGGMAALKAIRKSNYDVLSARRRVRTSDKFRLSAGALIRWIAPNG